MVGDKKTCLPLLLYLLLLQTKTESTSTGTEEVTQHTEEGSVTDLTAPTEQEGGSEETGQTSTDRQTSTDGQTLKTGQTSTDGQTTTDGQMSETGQTSTGLSTSTKSATTGFTLAPVRDVEGDEEKCKFVEYNGYIKIQCTAKNKVENETLTYFKCPNSNVNYVVRRGCRRQNDPKMIRRQFSAACQNDPKFYQMCGVLELNCHHLSWKEEESTTIEDMHYHPNFLCGQAVCDTDQNNRVYGTDLERDEECVNIPKSEDDTKTFTCTDAQSTKEINHSKKCDGECDCFYCSDESSCNGYHYGHHCHPEEYYLPMIALCDGETDCRDGSDENNCDKDKFPTCTGRLRVYNKTANESSVISVERLITNLTRCAAIGKKGTLPFCDDFSDQLDCTDPLMTNLTCLRRGISVRVANRMICYDNSNENYELPLCDDGFDQVCVKVDRLCTVHKHQLCDENEDCPNGADETHDICRDMSNHACERVLFGRESRLLRLPYSWINDGFKDCKNGEDESDRYQTCGESSATKRLVKSGEEDDDCEEVFLCGHPPSSHIEFEDLCDKINTCDIENDLCHIALDTPQISQYIRKQQDTLIFPLCFKGLETISEVIGLGECLNTNHTKDNETVLGRTNQVLRVPNKTFDCYHLYGEMYVYMSCAGLCSLETECLVNDSLQHDSCPGQYFSRVYTLAGENSLTFLLPYGDDKNKYHNNLFSCKNDKCIPYDKVCNLVNDCGDFSDEENCTNHFKCENHPEYIPLSSKCDGRADCQDFSDECNEQCSVRIIESVVLECAAWILGILATLFNLIIIFRGFHPLKKAYLAGVLTFSMRVFILLIATGDLLVGVYLLTISSFHNIYYHRYCPERYEWLTSLTCAVIGVVSTVGSMLSLFSMTFLSLMRALRMSKLSVGSRKTSNREVMAVLLVGLLVLAVSSAIAAAPLSKQFEDFFVNGISYPGNPLLVGSVTKSKHFKIFDKYYGRIRKKDLTWKHIDKLAMGMFSQEYLDSGIARNQVHFYGNAGVCLFKYFVTLDDPQRTYVWCVLLVNIACFTAITVAYIVIQYISSRSSSHLTQNQQNKKLTKRNQKLQRKIALIIGTNFCCWIPFVIMCCLHSSEVINASSYYSLFSLIVLPINSVLNPLLYDDTIATLIKRLRKRSTEQIRSIFSFSGITTERIVEGNPVLRRQSKSRTQAFFSDLMPLREARQAVKAETLREEDQNSIGHAKSSLVSFNVKAERVRSQQD